MTQAKLKKKSANQLYAERYLANLTTSWHDGYHYFVFQIKLNGELKFSDREGEVAWAEAAEYARKLIADVRERRQEVEVIKKMNAIALMELKSNDSKAVARAIGRLEKGIIAVGSPLKSVSKN
jgi:hypothetical protein